MAWAKKNSKPLGDDIIAISRVAMSYVSRREYAAEELRKKLIERGAEPAAAKESVDCMVQLRYVDDARFAAAFVRDRREFRPCGEIILRRDLAAKGVSPEIIDNAIAEEYDETRQREALHQLIEKAAASMPEDPAKKRPYVNRVSRRFIGKGFPQSMVMDEISCLRNSIEDDI